jgi:16S rRNA (uracil1498-N3)-methyltransferase
MRVLVPGGDLESPLLVGGRIELDDKEAHHLRVRRASTGEQVELLNGAGLRGAGRLRQTGKRWEVEIDQLLWEGRDPAITLAVAAGDRDRFSWMVEKAVELGVSVIVPVQTARTAGVATGIKDRHLPRLRRQALEATKQCGSAWVPAIENVIPLESFLRASSTAIRWLADEAGESPPTHLDQDPVTVVVGPEGGLSAAERSRLLEADYLPVSLSRSTLRFETAAIAAAAVIAAARARERHG